MKIRRFQFEFLQVIFHPCRIFGEAMFQDDELRDAWFFLEEHPLKVNLYFFVSFYFLHLHFIFKLKIALFSRTMQYFLA